MNKPDRRSEAKSLVSIESFRAGMRRLAAGVSLVTTKHGGERHGFAATSVTALSGEPPSLLVCVNRTTSGHDPLHGAGRFCVNVLARPQEAIAKTFSSSAFRHLRFAEGLWSEGAGPVLQGALAAFECSLDQTVRYGTHTIFIGLIEAIHTSDKGGEPLIYFDAKFTALAGRSD